jgi:hypothetical protein
VTQPQGYVYNRRRRVPTNVTQPPVHLPIPIKFLFVNRGYYTPQEIAERVNMPLCDVKSAIKSANKRGELEGRKHRGELQVRWGA